MTQIFVCKIHSSFVHSGKMVKTAQVSRNWCMVNCGIVIEWNSA